MLFEVGTQFKFDSLCDFQYLPIRGKPQSDVFDDLIPRLIPTVCFNLYPFSLILHFILLSNDFSCDRISLLLSVGGINQN